MYNIYYEEKKLKEEEKKKKEEETYLKYKNKYKSKFQKINNDYRNIAYYV